MNEHSLVQLGQGTYQQRIRATMTSKTSALAVDVAGDKKMTNRLLASAGLPVPRSEVVRTEDDAVVAAKRIGFPVVTKPLDGNHGRGVGLDLRTERAVRGGFKRAVSEARRGQVVVESYVTGNDYRVLVIGGHMVAIAERVPAHVTGDGKRTIAQLVEKANQDPRRGIGHEKVLTRIKIDDAARDLVKKQGFALEDVPPKGEQVLLAATGNMSTGGISIDRTWDAHEDNVEIAEEAARVVGLDVAGIDFLAPDISEAGARDRRGHRRGQRRAGVPDAHPSHRRRAAVRGQVRRRRAVPAGFAEPDPDPGGDGVQRQDHHHAHAGAHLPRAWAGAWA